MPMKPIDENELFDIEDEEPKEEPKKETKEPTFPFHHLEPKQNRFDEKFRNIERILGDLQSGWTVSIARVRPSWCSGYLERIELLDDEPIDLDYLVNTWGGEVLRLRVCDETGTWRGGADVALRTYPPRRHGKPIKAPDYQDFPEHSGAPAPPAAPPQLSPFDAYQKFAKSFQQSRREDIDLIRGMLPKQKTPENVGLENLSRLAETYEKLHGIFGNNSTPAAAIPGDDDFMGSINSLLATYMKSKELDAKQPKIPNRIGPPPSTSNHKQPALKPVTAVENDYPTLGIMADKLAALEATDAADVCIRALGDMPSEKRNEVMSQFLGMMNDTDQDEEQEQELEQEEIKEDAS